MTPRFTARGMGFAVLDLRDVGLWRPLSLPVDRPDTSAKRERSQKGRSVAPTNQAPNPPVSVVFTGCEIAVLLDFGVDATAM